MNFNSTIDLSKESINHNSNKTDRCEYDKNDLVKRTLNKNINDKFTSMQRMKSIFAPTNQITSCRF